MYIFLSSIFYLPFRTYETSILVDECVPEKIPQSTGTLHSLILVDT